MIEYGHIHVTSPIQLTLIPSLSNISKIGSPADIINKFSDLFYIKESEQIKYLSSLDHPNELMINKIAKASGRKALRAALIVISSCSDKLSTQLIGYYEMKGDREIYRKGIETQANIIGLARSLMINGVVGKSKRKSTQDNSEKLSEFNAIEYINMARIHLEMPMSESRDMTMTELVMLMESKYPDPDKQQDNNFKMNKAEYDKKMKIAKELNDKIKLQRSKK